MSDWPLLFRSGFGNVMPLGRWTNASTVLIAAAINSGAKRDWKMVEEYANDVRWVPEFAN